MSDSPRGEPSEPLAEASGVNGAATQDPGQSAEPGESGGLTDIEGLRDELTALRREAQDAKDLARRAQADLANVRRRARNERAEFRSRAVEEVSGGLLPVLDDLERAVAEVEKTTSRFDEDSANDPAANVVRGLHEGVRLVLKRFANSLAHQGLVEIEADGALFDPRLHDAVQETPATSGQRDGEVVVVLRRGYLLDGRVVRPATVVVAAGSAEDSSEPGPTAGDGEKTDDDPAMDAGQQGSPAEPVAN